MFSILIERLFGKALCCPKCGSLRRYKTGNVRYGKSKIYNVPEEMRDYNGGAYHPCGTRNYTYVLCKDCWKEIELETRPAKVDYENIVERHIREQGSIDIDAVAQSMVDKM